MPDVSPDTATPKPVYIAVLRAGELFIDRTYQRDLNEGWVARRIDTFDPRLFGLLEVADRDTSPDGGRSPDSGRRYAVIDGQQRHALAVEASTDGEDTPLAVRVHEGLTVAEEARLMHAIDRGRRPLTPWDRWKARRVAGDPVVLEVEAVAAGHGLRFASSTGPGASTATGAAERLHRDGGPGLLDAVLGVLARAWGEDQAAYHAPFLQAVGLLIHRHGERTDLDVLIDALARSRPWDVRSTAHAYRVSLHRSGSTAQLLAEAIVERYNRVAPRGRRLPAVP